MFLSVSEILKCNTDHTVSLLKKELEIELHELQEKWHFASLEKIFIENEIYQEIKGKTSKEEVYSAIDSALKPFIKNLMREVVTEDIARLTELPFMRISRYDRDKALENIAALEDRMEQVKHDLENLVDYAINYFQNIQKKYGKDKPRRTEIRVFDNIDATNVAVANEKFYINRAEGFIGTSLKKDEYVFDCSDLDDIITFRKDGTMQVTKVEAKTFIGKDILHVGVWKKNDKRTVYNMVYREGKDGPYYMKRFSVTGVIRNNEYKLASDVKGSEVLYFSANPNGEAEIISVLLKPNARIRKNRIDIDFSDLAIKGRDSKGNLVTKYAVKKIELKEEGISTLAPRKIWFDESVRRLMNRFDDDYLILEKWHPEQAVSCIYYDGEKDIYFIKRFLLENTANIQNFMPSEHPKSFIEFVGTSDGCTAEIIFAKDKNGKEKEPETIDIDDFISIKGIKAMGNQFVKEKIKSINITIPEPKEEEEEEPVQQEETDIPEDGVIGELF